MANSIVIFIDCQNDFFFGSLGSVAARSIIPNLVKRAYAAEENNELMVFTFDTHSRNDYLITLEGKFFPPHCLLQEKGWKIIKELEPFTERFESFSLVKDSFGFPSIGNRIYNYCSDDIKKITLVGVATDICVISNALILRLFFPNIEICVDASCCSGTTAEKHNAALDVMENCLITIENREEEE